MNTPGTCRNGCRRRTKLSAISYKLCSTAPNGDMIKGFEPPTFRSTPMFGFIVHVSRRVEGKSSENLPTDHKDDTSVE